MNNYTPPKALKMPFYETLLQQPHLLIAGSTGSGKSVIINGIIAHILQRTPAAAGMILIDPKRVELIDYKGLPHCCRYASEPSDMIAALNFGLEIMENRYYYMQQKHIKKHTGQHLYIIVDEFADLMTTNKKQAKPILCRLAQLGRAARVHLIIATQRPTRDIIDGQIKVNLDSRIALRCPTPQDSRNIIDRRGAEDLPRFGEGYFMAAADFEKVKIPMYPEDAIQEIIQAWKAQQIPPHY